MSLVETGVEHKSRSLAYPDQQEGHPAVLPKQVTNILITAVRWHAVGCICRLNFDFAVGPEMHMRRIRIGYSSQPRQPQPRTPSVCACVRGWHENMFSVPFRALTRQASKVILGRTQDALLVALRRVMHHQVGHEGHHIEHDLQIRHTKRLQGLIRAV